MQMGMKTRRIAFGRLCLSAVMAVALSGCAEEPAPEAAKVLTADKKTITVEAAGGEVLLTVNANVPFRAANSQPWLKKEETPARSEAPAQERLRYRAEVNYSDVERRDTIRITPTGTGEAEAQLRPLRIPVLQKGRATPPVEGDRKIRLTKVRLVQGGYYDGEIPEKSIDGDYATYYGSGKKNRPDLPVILEFDVAAGTDRVDYLYLYNRQNKENNRLTKGTVDFKTAKAADWTGCGGFDVSGYPDRIKVPLKGALQPVSFRLTLERNSYDPENPMALSLAEVEAFRRSDSAQHTEEDAQFFADPLLSALKAGFREEDLSKISSPILREMAHKMLIGQYDTEFRLRTYHSQRHPAFVCKELTIGKRSVCDNPTGIWFEKGKEYVVAVGEEAGDRSLELGIYDWRGCDENHKEGSSGGELKRGWNMLSLHKGLNVITAPRDGTGYLHYWTEDAAALPDVRIHFCMGNQIGFWDKTVHDDADWPRILRLARACATERKIKKPMMDVSGNLVQMINTLDAFERNCNGKDLKVSEWIGRFDRLMEIEYRTMGLVKHDAVPKDSKGHVNRMLGVRTWGGSPNWNGTCANFPAADAGGNEKQAQMFQEVVFTGGGKKGENGPWMYGHEFGHGNQNAQMKDAGWTEVTNNIYSQHVTYEMTAKKYCRIDHHAYKRNPGGKTEPSLCGELVNSYLHDALLEGRPYLCYQEKTEEKDGHLRHSANVFCLLSPLWQLSLYFMIPEGPLLQPDFWPDVIWDAMHDRTSEQKDWGGHYLNFMKRAIRFSGYNLCPFFRAIGLLRPEGLDIWVGDYGPDKHVVIPAAQMQEVERLGAALPDTPSPVLHYISAYSLDAFKNRLAVTGTPGKGVQQASGWEARLIDGEVWKNAVAFETFAGTRLVEVCIAGTHLEDSDSRFTFVRYPAGSTCIKAVAWDGKRTVVYGKAE